MVLPKVLEDVRHTVTHALLHPVDAERLAPSMLAHASNYHTKDTVSELVGHGGEDGGF